MNSSPNDSFYKILIESLRLVMFHITQTKFASRYVRKRSFSMMIMRNIFNDTYFLIIREIWPRACFDVVMSQYSSRGIHLSKNIILHNPAKNYLKNYHYSKMMHKLF